MSAQNLLSGGDKYYSYSGVVFGDVSVPASIQLILIPNTGLRDSYVNIQSFCGQPITDNNNDGLGIEVKLDDTTIYKSQTFRGNRWTLNNDNPIILFIPRQSKLEVISLNTTNNNTQERGANLIGYYL
jgi:hypothetical protein